MAKRTVSITILVQALLAQVGYLERCETECLIAKGQFWLVFLTATVLVVSGRPTPRALGLPAPPLCKEKLKCLAAIHKYQSLAPHWRAHH
eukprot:688856-Amphidinium_carterae.1